MDCGNLWYNNDGDTMVQSESMKQINEVCNCLLQYPDLLNKMDMVIIRHLQAFIADQHQRSESNEQNFIAGMNRITEKFPEFKDQFPMLIMKLNHSIMYMMHQEQFVSLPISSQIMLDNWLMSYGNYPVDYQETMSVFLDQALLDNIAQTKDSNRTTIHYLVSDYLDPIMGEYSTPEQIKSYRNDINNIVHYLQKNTIDEYQAKQRTQIGLDNWANHVLDRYGESYPEKAAQLKQRLTATRVIYEMSTIDFKRYLAMIQVIQNNYQIPESVIYMITLTSLASYNPAILSYSMEEILVLVQAFAKIEPSNYQIYNNPKTPFISNRTFIEQILKEHGHDISSATNDVRVSMEGCEVTYDSPYTK